MNREYLRMRLSGDTRIALWSGQRPVSQPLKPGLDCDALPFGADQFSDPVQPSGAFFRPDYPLPGKADDRGAESDRDWWAAHGKPDMGLAKLAALARKADGCRGSSGHGLRTKRI